MAKTEKRSTQQKRAIREALYKMDNHPTASMVAEYLAEQGEKVSRATVFRVLADAAEEGTISKVQLTGEDVRYDCKTGLHYHMHCRCCGKIIDAVMPYHIELDKQANENGFRVEKHEIEFIGLCSECAAQCPD